MKEDMRSEASVVKVVEGNCISAIFWRSRYKMLRRRGFISLVAVFVVANLVLNDFHKISHQEHTDNVGYLTIVVNFEADIVRTAALDPTLYTGIGKDVVEVRSGTAIWSSAVSRAGNWWQRFVARRPVQLGIRQLQCMTTQNG